MTTKAQTAKSQPPIYGLAEAKARLSELVEKAQQAGPQEIRRRGRPVAFVVSAEEWKKQTRPRGSMLDFFRESGLLNLGVEWDDASRTFRDAGV